MLQERNNIRNEIIECLENYKAVYSFLEENGVNRSIQSEMDKMPDVYTKNLLMKIYRWLSIWISWIAIMLRKRCCCGAGKS